MCEPAYISIGDDGHLTLYWGDGSEDEKVPIRRGPPASEGATLERSVAELKAWAEAHGYTVVVPIFDLELPDVPIDVDEDEIDDIDLDEVDDLLDDLYFAGDYDEDEDD
jgi:hypothetical protein